MNVKTDSSQPWQVGSRYFFERLAGSIIALSAIALAHDGVMRVLLAALAVGAFFDDGSVPGWFLVGFGAAVVGGAVFDAINGLFVAAVSGVALCFASLVPVVREKVPIVDLCAMACVALLIRSWVGLFVALAVLTLGAGVAVFSRRPRFPLVPYAAVAAALVVSQGW